MRRVNTQRFCADIWEEWFMKKQMMAMILFLFTFVLISDGQSAEKPRLGVLRFTNNTHAGWWHGGMGGELQDMLIAELASTKSFSVLE
jgi:hypothetical protein